MDGPVGRNRDNPQWGQVRVEIEDLLEYFRINIQGLSATATDAFAVRVRQV